MRILNRLFLKAYGGLWRAAVPLLRRNKRLRDNFNQRLVPADWPTGENVPAGSRFSGRGSRHPLRVWIQAASGGEAWLVHSLVSALTGHPALDARPLELLCTTWTRQGLDILNRIAPPPRPLAPVSVLPRFFPLDHPGLMRRAIAAARPDAVVLLETELWPGLLAAARARQIPVLVLNARMTEKSFRACARAAFFWPAHAPERILAISGADAERFARLFGRPERVEIMPNIKFDRVAGAAVPAPGSEDPAAFRADTGLDDKVLLAVLASVREEEEALLLPLVSALHGLSLEGHPVAVAVAPRHPHRVEAWKAGLTRAGLNFHLRSRHPRSGRPLSGRPGGDACSGPVPPVYLWDSFGELPSLYAIADAVYVGASLVPLGGQNFLEPLAQGVIPLVGPHLDNFLWIGEEIFAEGLAVRLSGQDEARAAFEQRLRLRLESLRRAGDGQNWHLVRASEKAGVQQRFAAWLRPRLGGSGQAAEALIRLSAETPLHTSRRWKESPGPASI